MKTKLLILASAILLGMLTSCATTSAELYDVPAKYPEKIAPWPNEDDDVLVWANFNADVSKRGFEELVVKPINKDNVSFDSLDDDSKKTQDAKNTKRDDDADEVAQQFLNDMDTIYQEKMQTLEESISIPVVWNNAAGDKKALILETNAVVVNPGSRSARYFASFGAGATDLVLDGRLIDGDTNEVLVEFRAQDRGLGGAYGGDSYDLLVDNMEEVAIAKIGSLIYSSLSE